MSVRGLLGANPRNRLIVAQLLKLRWRVAALMALTALNIALITGNPIILSAVISTSASATGTHQPIALAGAYITITAVNYVLSLFAGRAAVDLAQRITDDLRLQLVRRLLSGQRKFLETHSVGELVERVDGDTTTLERAFGQFVFDVVATALLIAAVLVASLFANVRLGLVLVALALVGLVGVFYAQCRSRVMLQGERRARAQVRGLLQERISAREEIRATATENHVLHQMAVALNRLRSAMARAGLGARASSSALEISVAAALAAVLGVGGLLLQVDAATLAQVFLVYQYVALLSTALSRLSLRLFDMATASGGFDRIVQILALDVASVAAPRGGPRSGSGSVEFHRVHFSYGSEPVLHDVSFSVARGHSLAVIGRSGSGKSTIANLTWGAFSVAAGQVCVDGVPIDEIGRQELHRLVGVVTQDVHIFDATVRDNVTMFDHDVPDDVVRSALDALGLGYWQETLAEGLSTLLSSSGTNLSVGQRHLLGVARILVRDPPIVVLDEITAHLDPATEDLVNAATQILVRNRTAVLISHHRTVLDIATDVLVLDAGKVAWRGPSQALPAEMRQRLVDRPFA